MNAAHSMPGFAAFVNRWMSRRLSNWPGCDLPDSQCGFRLINLAALNEISLGTTHFEIESEVLLEFIGHGFAVEFVPVQVIYQ